MPHTLKNYAFKIEKFIFVILYSPIQLHQFIRSVYRINALILSGKNILITILFHIIHERTRGGGEGGQIFPEIRSFKKRDFTPSQLFFSFYPHLESFLGTPLIALIIEKHFCQLSFDWLILL